MQENVNIPDSTITTNLSFRQLVLMNMQQLTNFPYIEKDFDALTNYELLCLVVKYLNDVIANQNEQNNSITRMYESFLALQTYVNNTKDTLEDAFNNLDNYVRNYFNNLDVQEEINNKLDEMLEDGVLEQIIEQYLQSSALWCFDTVASMKAATNLINGSYAKTMGYYSLNDGGESNYKIRTKTVEDVPNDGDLIAIGDTLVAELIIENNTINVKQLGLSSDSENNSLLLQNAIDKYDNITLFFPYGNYTFNTSIDLDGKTDIKFLGQCSNKYNQNLDSHLLFKTSDGNAFINVLRLSFEKLSIDGYNKTGTGISGRFVVRKCHILRFSTALDGKGYITESSIYQNNNGIIHAVDSRIINNQFYNNTQSGIKLTNGNNDNIITNNKIEWNGEHGITLYSCANNIVSNNIIDRNTEYGMRIVSCTHSLINGNLLRRNYIDETEGNTHAQIRLESCNYVSLLNNVTRTGNTQDDNTGYTVPYKAAYISQNQNCIISGNDFSGGTSSPTVVLYNNVNDTIFYLNDAISFQNQIETYKENQLFNSSIQSGSNGTVTLDIDTLDRYNYRMYYFEIMYRTSANSQYNAQFIPVMVYKSSADGTNTMGVKINNDSSLVIQNITITANVSYDTDNSQYKLNIVITNNAGETIVSRCRKLNFI